MIEITGAGHTWPIHPNFCLNRKNGHTDYTFLHFDANESLQINGITINPSRHSCIIFKPGTPQHFYSPRSMFHDWFHFINPPIGFFEKLEIPTDVLLFPDRCTFISNIVEEIENEFYNQSDRMNELIDVKVKELFIKLSRALKTHSKEPVIEKTVSDFRNLRRELRGSLSHDWSINEMAERLHLSPSHFSHLYKKIYSTTPIGDLIEARIDNAKSALLFTDKSIEEIALSLGYNNTTHFCRQFHKYVNLSPSQYKKLNK